MSKKYNKTFTNLKTVVNDTSILNAQKILVNTPEDTFSERTDIIDYIGKSVDKLEDKVEFYISDVTHAPEQDSGRTSLVAFVIPVDTYPSDKIFTYVKADARQYVSEGVPCETPAYLGLMTQDIILNENGDIAEEIREIIALSDNAIVPQSDTPSIWNFSKGFIIPSGKKIAGFFIKNVEDFVAPNPTVHSDLRVNLPMHTCANASGDFPDKSAKIDPEKGYHFGGSFDFANDGWWGWPVIGMGEVAHYKNLTHLTLEQVEKLNNLNLESLVSKDEIEKTLGVTKFESTDISAATADFDWDALHYKTVSSIPHNKNINSVTLLPQNTNTDLPLYLAAWYVNSSNVKTWIGMSDNAITWESGKEATWTFINNPLNIPDNCKLELFLSTEVLDNPVSDPPHPGIYFKSLGNDSIAATHRWGGSWYSACGTAYTIFEKIQHIGDASHITAADRIKLDNIDEELSNIKTNITALEEDNSLIFDELFSEETSDFTTNTANQLDASGAIITGLRISKAHFLPGDTLIRDITLAYPSSKTDAMFTEQWLHLYVYDESGNKIKTIFSTETRTRTAEDTDKFTSWTFGKDAILPENYHTLEIYLSSGVAPITANTATQFRANITKSNGSTTYDNDECCCWNGGTEYNWLAEVQATYSVRQEPLYDIMESLRGKSFAYVDEDNTFTAKNTFNSLNAVITDSAESKANSLEASKRLTIDTEILEKDDVADLKRIVLGKTATSTLIGESQGSNGITGVYGCQYTNPHFPAGNIVNIRVYHNIHHTDFFPSKPVYLYLNIDGSTVHRSMVPVVWTEPVSYSDFKFDNVSIPSTYTTVDVLMSHESSFEPLADGTVVPSFTNYTNCIKFSADYSYHADFASCKTRVDAGVGAVALRLEVTSISTEDSELLSYAKKDEANIFTETNTFDNGVISNNNVLVTGGNILLNKNCSIKFLDDGEVTITGGASGYPIINGIPTSISNSIIYNVGLISADTDLSGMVFDGDETIVQSCEVWFTTGDTIYNITWPTGTYWIDYDGGAMPTLHTNTKYRIVLRKEIDDLIASISHSYPAS